MYVFTRQCKMKFKFKLKHTQKYVIHVLGWLCLPTYMHRLAFKRKLDNQRCNRQKLTEALIEFDFISGIIFALDAAEMILECSESFVTSMSISHSYGVWVLCNKLHAFYFLFNYTYTKDIFYL